MIAMDIYIKDYAQLRKNNTDIYNLLESLRKLLSYEKEHKKELGYQKTHHERFYICCNKLFRFYNKYDSTSYNKTAFEADKQALIKEIKVQKMTYENWFMERIGNINK